MVHSALLRVFLNLEVSLSTVGTDGRDCESPYLLRCSLTVEVRGRSEKKKGGYPHGRPAQCIMICDEKRTSIEKGRAGTMSPRLPSL